MLGADLVRGAVAVTRDEPSGVVVGNELLQPAAQVLDGVEGVHPQEVLFEGADEALGDAVTSPLTKSAAQTFGTSRSGPALSLHPR